MFEHSTGDILIADDQAHILDALSILLESEGFGVHTAQSPAEVLNLLKQRSFDLLLTDMNFTKDTTSGNEGLALVKAVREQDGMLPIVVMTAWASIELSVQAMNGGANDFIEKPWKNHRLLSLLNNQLGLLAEKRSNRRLTALATNHGASEQLIIGSDAMLEVMTLIERTAKSDANILLTGESGVGKSLIAGMIHRLSLRKDKPLVNVNMGALTDTLFASELFGHIKGAFTDAKNTRIGRFEMADSGTLFMDEIANIPKALQAKLLRVLEAGEFEPLGASRTQKVDVRIVSASNVNFVNEVEAGNFRQDLLYRLNTITIDIPALRTRPDDILPLAKHFKQQFQRKYRRAEIFLDTDTQTLMLSYGWPGNVRELAHCMERAVLVCLDDIIKPQDLGLTTANVSTHFENMTLAQAEQTLIHNALNRFGQNVASAAEVLGLSRNALYRRMEKHAIATDINHDED